MKEHFTGFLLLVDIFISSSMDQNVPLNTYDFYWSYNVYNNEASVDKW